MPPPRPSRARRRTRRAARGQALRRTRARRAHVPRTRRARGTRTARSSSTPTSRRSPNANRVGPRSKMVPASAQRRSNASPATAAFGSRSTSEPRRSTSVGEPATSRPRCAGRSSIAITASAGFRAAPTGPAPGPSPPALVPEGPDEEAEPAPGLPLPPQGSARGWLARDRGCRRRADVLGSERPPDARGIAPAAEVRCQGDPATARASGVHIKPTPSSRSRAPENASTSTTQYRLLWHLDPPKFN